MNLTILKSPVDHTGSHIAQIIFRLHITTLLSYSLDHATTQHNQLWVMGREDEVLSLINGRFCFIFVFGSIVCLEMYYDTNKRGTFICVSQKSKEMLKERFLKYLREKLLSVVKDQCGFQEGKINEARKMVCYGFYMLFKKWMGPER